MALPDSTAERSVSSGGAGDQGFSARKDLHWLAWLLGFAFVAGVCAHLKLPAGIDLSEYGTPTLEFARTHHLGSVYLPPGLSIIEGTAMDLFHGEAGLAVADISIYLAWIALVWVLLQQLGATAKQAFVVGMVFAVYPDIWLGINRIYQTNLSTVCLFATIVCLIHFVRSRTSFAADALLACVFGFSLICRSNLVALIPLTWVLLWRYKLPHGLARAAGQAVVVFVIYAAVTIAVHGSIFWPQVGTYCLFSGANEYTEMDMKRDYNNTAEGSIIPALKLRGIDAYADWGHPQDIPGDSEIRNPRFAPIYLHEAIKFEEQHPRTMVKLTGLKFINLVRPDLKVHPAGSFGGVLKILATLALPLWIAAFFLLPHGRKDPARLIVGLTVPLFLLPYVATVTAPKFRIPIDALCFLHTAAMLIVWRRMRYLASTPRPAA